MSESGDQIHHATPARRQQARTDGDIPKSLELAAAVQMIGVLIVAYLLFGHVGHWLRTWTTETWLNAGTQLSVQPEEFTHQLQNTMGAALVVLAPVLGLFLIIGIGSHWLQTGPLFISKRITPDPTRLGPANWKRQVFSFGNLAYLLIGIPKIIIAGVVLAASTWAHRNDFFALANRPMDTMVTEMFHLILVVSIQVALALLVTSVADYAMKWTSHQRRIRMTDQELRDELRMQNGGR